MSSADFANFFNDTILVEPYLSRDGYGKPTYGSSVLYKARVEAGQRQVIDMRGDERLSRGRVFILGNPPLSPDDRLQLPAWFVPQNPVILGIARSTDENGQPHHVVVELG